MDVAYQGTVARPTMKGEGSRLLEAGDWRHVRTTGSHRHYKHPSKPKVVTIPKHPGDEAAGLEKK